MKPSTAKAKGRETENLVVEWLRKQGWIHAERKRLQGSADQGDITGIPGMCIEVKSAAHWQPVEWLRQTEIERMNSMAEVAWCIARPKGKPVVDDWVILMTPAQLMELLAAAGWVPDSESGTSQSH